jgi:NDP-sugar pyrophosphorylase family protein
LDGDFIVLNADTYVDAEAYALAVRSVSPTMVVRHVQDCSRYGAIRLDDSDNVLDMNEKGVSGHGLISMGIYRLHPDDLGGSRVKACSMENELLPRLVGSGRVKGLRYSGDFIDIGTPESLATIRQKGFTIPS